MSPKWLLKKGYAKEAAGDTKLNNAVLEKKSPSPKPKHGWALDVCVTLEKINKLKNRKRTPTRVFPQ